MAPDRRAARREKRGRPSFLDDPQKIGIFIPGPLYDRVHRHAIQHHGTNIAAAVRELLESGLIHSDCQKARDLA